MCVLTLVFISQTPEESTVSKKKKKKTKQSKSDENDSGVEVYFREDEDKEEVTKSVSVKVSEYNAAQFSLQ